MSGRTELIAPRWYRRVLLWVAVLVTTPPALRLRFGLGDGVWSILDVVLLTVGLGLLMWTVFAQGVVASPDGLRVRRPTRGRRTATWDEVVRCTGGAYEEVPVVHLRDGTRLVVTDVTGDNAHVRERLEAARERWGPQPEPPDHPGPDV